jgi:hypothetical protein
LQHPAAATVVFSQHTRLVCVFRQFGPAYQYTCSALLLLLLQGGQTLNGHGKRGFVFTDDWEKHALQEAAIAATKREKFN